MILALDVGTSSARAALYDESGVPVPRRFHRVAYEPTITADGGVEHDPNVVLAAVATCLDAVLTGPRLPDVAGVGVATFRHGLLGFGPPGPAGTRRRWPPPGSRRPSCFRSWIVTSRGEICGPRGPVAGRHCAACPGSRPSAMARRATPAPSASIRRVSRSTWARRQRCAR